MQGSLSSHSHRELACVIYDHIDVAVDLDRFGRNSPELVDVRGDIQLEDVRSKCLEVFNGVKGLRTRRRDDLVSSGEGSKRQLTPDSRPRFIQQSQ